MNSGKQEANSCHQIHVISFIFFSLFDWPFGDNWTNHLNLAHDLWPLCQLWRSSRDYMLTSTSNMTLKCFDEVYSSDCWIADWLTSTVYNSNQMDGLTFFLFRFYSRLSEFH